MLIVPGTTLDPGVNFDWNDEPVGYALVVDALTHGGLASADRIDRRVCAAPLMPGVDPATLPANEARYGGD
ncbi:MAG TPA: hypothetical protein VH008_17315 [Pseudonocardia sp.]|nr:hypothetical protein [Pseudonocardia sp.]